MILLLPWLVGFAGFGVGLPIVGGDSYWLFAFAYVPVAISYVAVMWELSS